MTFCFISLRPRATGRGAPGTCSGRTGVGCRSRSRGTSACQPCPHGSSPHCAAENRHTDATGEARSLTRHGEERSAPGCTLSSCQCSDASRLREKIAREDVVGHSSKARAAPAPCAHGSGRDAPLLCLGGDRCGYPVTEDTLGEHPPGFSHPRAAGRGEGGSETGSNLPAPHGDTIRVKGAASPGGSAGPLGGAAEG